MRGRSLWSLARWGSVLAVLLIVAAAPNIWGTAVDQLDIMNAGKGPSSDHWFGTDNLGRDVLWRTILAARLTLSLALGATMIAFAIALPLGSMLAMAQGVGRVIGLRTLDAMLAIPGILVAIVIATILGPGTTTAVLAVGLSSVPAIVRLTFALTSSLIERDFVYGARLLGVSGFALIRRHILPNISDPLMVALATSIAFALVEVSALSFLGLGIQPPAYDWGYLLVDGAQAAYVNPAAAVPPAAAIVLTGMVVGYLGDRVAVLLNPQRRQVERAMPGRVRPTGGMRTEDVPEQSAPPVTGQELLATRDLTVSLMRAGERQALVAGINLTVAPGEIVGVLGESGCGKSLTALAIGVLLERPLVATAARHIVGGEDLNVLPESRRADHLAGSVAYVFQDPGGSLNPALTIERQMVEAAMFHSRLSWKDALDRAREKLSLVGLAPGDNLFSRFPHQLSGGMKQRVMVAMALMTDPSLIIADEPTTALDVTIQAQVLKVLKGINRDLGTSMILITHDIGVLAEVCTRAIVMYAGRIVEEATVDQLADRPLHPYSRALLESVPTLHTDKECELYAIPGRPPLPDEVAGMTGCSFASRCSRATEICRNARPPLQVFPGKRSAACWHVGEVTTEGRPSGEWPTTKRTASMRDPYE